MGEGFKLVEASQDALSRIRRQIVRLDHLVEVREGAFPDPYPRHIDLSSESGTAFPSSASFSESCTRS